MYLVHTVLTPGRTGGPLPDGAREILRAALRPEDRIEHLVLHSGAESAAVLGAYLLADSLAEAESRAALFCHHALSTLPQFAGWGAEPSTVPMVAPFYERLLAASGLDGRNGPRPFPST
ncbi:hypothetical protein OHV05_07960 [Kitasatospora sp. NBC_00070]|uniref:hypothetical protein n=1 Tax=Kitasatospora sp. NBC_00070 TaxID=2975962 RepID=UPI00324AF0C1